MSIHITIDSGAEVPDDVAEDVDVDVDDDDDDDDDDVVDDWLGRSFFFFLSIYCGSK